MIQMSQNLLNIFKYIQGLKYFSTDYVKNTIRLIFKPWITVMKPFGNPNDIKYYKYKTLRILMRVSCHKCDVIYEKGLYSIDYIKKFSRRVIQTYTGE